MSKTIDNRVVEMEFDNRQFEKNVSTTMSTLDKLKQKLNLSGASKGLEDLGTASKKCDLSPIGKAADAVGVKFSAMQVIGVTALANITNSAVNAGKQLLKSLTITPITTGFQEYELKMGSIQTIMASTGESLETVNQYLDELNTYSDKTIYSFQDMTSNIGKFTNAGVKLEDAVLAIKGISNEAAVSGANANEASRAMYNFAQALSAGYVKLIDWKSIENANMATVEFKNQLIETALSLGTVTKSADGMYKTLSGNAFNATKNFNEVFQDQWMTSEVLIETLKKYADETTEIGKKAYASAQDVKTFSMMMDTLKESIQSGWAQTWEILVGDFEEAKGLFTEMTNVISGIIDQFTKSRNNLLQGWKGLGGRTKLINSLKNAFEGIASIIKPISQAFREIFPPITAKRLYDITKSFEELTKKLILSDKKTEQLKSTFKGLFAIIDIFATIVKSVVGGAMKLVGAITGLSGGLLGITGTFGEWLSDLRDGIKEIDIFGKGINTITDFLVNAINALKDFGTSITENVGSSGFIGFLNSIWTAIGTVGSKIVDLFLSVGESIANFFGSSNFGEALNSGLFAGILVGIYKFVKTLTNSFEGVSGVLDNITGILDDVRGCFKAYQDQLKAGTLMKIAAAIAILAAAILVISTIDVGALTKSLIAIKILFTQLLGSLTSFSNISTSFRDATKAISLMIGISIAVVILAGALKKISSINVKDIIKGLVAIGVLMTEISIFLNMAKFNGKITRASIGIVILSSALLILSKAVENFGDMKWNEIKKGLVSIAALLTELAIFTNVTGNAKHIITTGVAMMMFGSAMKMFSSAIKDISGMSWKNLTKGLAGIAGSLLAVSIAIKFMPKNTIGIGLGLIAISTALTILANSLNKMGNMLWEEIGKGLAALGGSMVILAIGLNAMRGTLMGSAALVVAVAALTALVPILRVLGLMSWESIAKGLIAIAGAFTIIGIAGAVLTPLIPTILGLAAALTLVGVGMLGIGISLMAAGAGLSAIAVAFTTLASITVVSATAIATSLTIIITSIANLIPLIIEKIGEGIVAFCGVIANSATAIGEAIKAVILSLVDVLVECAPAIVDGAFKLIVEVLESLVKYTPQIVDYIFQFLIKILDSVADKIPTLIQSIINVLASLFSGILDALGDIDIDTLLKAIGAVGLLTALMVALGAISSLIPSAMIGVLGLGIIIAEFGLVLAAIGALAQIPGLQWLISEGGQFLQTIGTAIGQFVGGIIGGFAEGVSSSLPQIASDLSAFMTNLQPFIEGARSIDASILEGVKSLASTILILTGADILNSIASWITGDNSLADFADQLLPFGKAMKEFSITVSGIDTASITASATAAKALTDVASAIPNYGGIFSAFTGDNDISDFGTKMVMFGQALMNYSKTVTGLAVEPINTSILAATSLSKLSNALPKDGGILSWAKDDKMDFSKFSSQLQSLGKGMKSYSEEVAGINSGAINSSIYQIQRLISLIKSMSGLDTSGIGTFKKALSGLSKINSNDLTGLTDSLSSSASSLSSVGANMADSIAKGFKFKSNQFKPLGISIVANLLNSIKQKSSAFKSVGTELMNKFALGIKTQSAKVKSSMTTVVGSSINGIRSYRTSFYNAGSYLVSGFTLGISSNSYRASLAAKAMASAAAKAAEEALDEHSPSKVGYRIGDYFGIAFVNAIRDNVNSAYNASSDMASSAKDGLNEALSDLAYAFSGDLDNINPVISPILDLSNIESGTAAIGDMLNTTPSLGVLSELRAINARTNNQNGTINDVVSSINRMNKNLQELDRNSYNINGINYEESSDVAEAIKTLVRAAKIERRT